MSWPYSPFDESIVFDEEVYVRPVRGVQTHRVKAAARRRVSNYGAQYGPGPIFLYKTWCGTVLVEEVDDGDPRYVCRRCERAAILSGYTGRPPSIGRIPVMACDLEAGQRWCQ